MPMTRSQAIGKIEDAMALRKLGTNPAIFRDFAEDHVALLETLGVLKFDADPAFRSGVVQRHPPAAERRQTPAEVLARVVLGPGSCAGVFTTGGPWLVGPGADGADRIVDALKVAGYRIVRPINLSKPDHPLKYETFLVESEG